MAGVPMGIRELRDNLTAVMRRVRSGETLRAAARLTSRTVRTFDAIHLASALRVDADEFLAYDRALLAAAIQHGLVASHAGADS